MTAKSVISVCFWNDDDEPCLRRNAKFWPPCAEPSFPAVVLLLPSEPMEVAESMRFRISGAGEGASSGIVGMPMAAMLAKQMRPGVPTQPHERRRFGASGSASAKGH